MITKINYKIIIFEQLMRGKKYSSGDTEEQQSTHLPSIIRTNIFFYICFCLLHWLVPLPKFPHHRDFPNKLNLAKSILFTHVHLKILLADALKKIYAGMFAVVLKRKSLKRKSYTRNSAYTTEHTYIFIFHIICRFVPLPNWSMLLQQAQLSQIKILHTHDT